MPQMVALYNGMGGGAAGAIAAVELVGGHGSGGGAQVRRDGAETLMARSRFPGR